ncbi:MAG: manganese efflux pump MntP family protein [Candidatus Scatosoma sp.]
MNLFDILLLAVALSMDAAAVSMTNGMTVKTGAKTTFLTAFLFGLFQAAMPLIGYFATEAISGAFREAFEKISAWVAFLLLAFIGGKMIADSIKERKAKKNGQEDIPCGEKTLSFGEMIAQAFATSIDALAVGISLKMAAIGEGLFPSIGWSVAIIGCVTFLLSLLSVRLGKLIGNKLADKAEILGGAVLILIGLKILLF